jgi:hypothetical protein
MPAGFVWTGIARLLETLIPQATDSPFSGFPHVKERSTKKRPSRTFLFALLPLFFPGIVPGLRGSPGATERVNLALHKPAYSSSIENDEHGAAQANDGDSNTCWTADDEPEDGPEWWMVDLGKPCALSGCAIRWPFAGKKYRYKVEGSADHQVWSLLSDQTKSATTARVHDLKFPKARQIRYLKITVTGLDQGCWASISEVQVFGLAHSPSTKLAKSAL